MRRLLLVVIAGGLVWPAGASAHVLPLATAEAKARSEAFLLAGNLNDRPRISVRSSRRLSGHVVEVRVRYRFRDRAQTCRVQRMRVRLAASPSQRLTVSFPFALSRC